MFAVWQTLFMSEGEAAQSAPVPSPDAGPSNTNAGPVAVLQQLRQKSGSIWVVVLSGGGHFAAAVFSLQPAPAKGSNAPRADTPFFQVVAHKTFHRYVVR